MTDAVENTQAEETTSAKTYTEAEVNELVAGLKKNNEALLAEKKEAARIAKEAKDAQILADQERAKKDGDLSTLEKSLTEQFGKQISEKDARLTMMSERILGAERKSVINSLSGMLVDESAADILGMMVKTEFDGDDVVTKFVDGNGNVITTDPAKFKEWLKGHKAFSHLIKSDAATGGGAGGSKTNPGGASGADAIQQKLNAKYGKRG
jgi:hypothetical protein